MPLKTIEEIKRDLKNRIYHPVYLFQGEEPYYIDQLAGIIENGVLNEMEREFDQVVLYGKDCDAAGLASTAKRYPMLSGYQVVIVKEAQEMKALFPKAQKEDADKKDSSKEKDDPLLNYIVQPQPSTILVFCVKYKGLDKRGKIFKAIDKNGVVFEMKKIYDDKLAPWIEQYLFASGTKITPKAALLMAEHLGNDLSRIANECDKLRINLKKDEIIDLHHIELYIGVSKDFNVFELQKAIGEKDFLVSMKIANYFAANPKEHPIQATIAVMYNFFSKLLLYHSLPDKSKNSVAAALKINPFFIRDYTQAAGNYSYLKLESIVSLLKEYDLKSKGVGSNSTPDGDLLRELLVRIIQS